MDNILTRPTTTSMNRKEKKQQKQLRVAKAIAKSASPTKTKQQKRQKSEKVGREKVRELPTFWTEASSRFPDASDDEHDTLIFIFAQASHLRRELDWSLHKSFQASRKVFNDHIPTLANVGLFKYQADDDLDPATSMTYALLESIGEELKIEKIAMFIEPLTGSHDEPATFIRDRLPLIERIVMLDMVQEIFEESINPGVIVVIDKAHDFIDYLDQRLCDRISAELVADGDY